MRRSFLVLYFTGVIAVMFCATVSASLGRSVLQAAADIWNVKAEAPFEKTGGAESW